MAVNAEQIVVRLPNAAADLDNAQQTVNRAKQFVAQARSQVAALGSTYGDVISAITAGAAANPANAWWQQQDALRAILVARAQALSAEIDAIATALGL